MRWPSVEKNFNKTSFSRCLVSYHTLELQTSDIRIMQKMLVIGLHSLSHSAKQVNAKKQSMSVKMKKCLALSAFDIRPGYDLN